jgi:hypothetical protein
MAAHTIDTSGVPVERIVNTVASAFGDSQTQTAER